jgi:hypothetical protein
MVAEGKMEGALFRRNYVVEDKCGFHPMVDEEFQRSLSSAMVGLQPPRFATAQASFDRAYNYEASTPPDHKAAMATLFDATTTAFRLARLPRLI